MSLEIGISGLLFDEGRSEVLVYFGSTVTKAGSHEI